MRELQDTIVEGEVLKLMRDRLLMDLVLTEGNNRHSLKTKLSYLNLNTSFSFPALAVIDASDYFPNTHEKRKYIAMVMDFLSEFLLDENIIFMDGEGRLVVIFSWESKHLIEEAQIKINKQFSIPLSTGISNPSKTLEHIHVSYKQALIALQNKFYKGIGEVLFFKDCKKYHEATEYPLEGEMQLFECIKHAEDSKEIKQAIEEFYQCVLKEGIVDHKFIYEITIRLLVGIEKKVYSQLGDLSTYHHCKIMSVIHLETIQEVKEYVAAHLIELHQILAYNDNRRSVIKKAIQFMEKECQHATLQSVSEKVYIAPTYLSSLFKINTGKTFIEKLTQIRIEKAKDMLVSTHMKNYEVAEKVGYKDSRYFSQIFKKVVGVTPTEYRESVASKL